jgi:4-hydroxybenzoate polyprenyltransferase
MTYKKKLTRFSPLGQAMIFVVFLLMFIVRWFFFGSVLRSFNYDFILLPLAAIVGGLLIYTRYRQRERQRIREANIKVAAIIEQARQEAGLVDETETRKINEYHLDEESNGLPQSG